MKYRMTIFPALEKERRSIIFSYETAEQMETARDTAARLLMFIQDDLKAMSDYSNIFMLEEHINGEWEEYEEF